MDIRDIPFYVVCPAGVETGGPEALHMLAGELRGMGLNAYICYLPFSLEQEVPANYQCYGVVAGVFEDSAESVVIVPEVYPMLALRLQSRHRFLWWLSLSNYFSHKGDSALRDGFRYLKARIRGHRPWRLETLGVLKHLSQSATVDHHLCRYGFQPSNLSDYLNPLFLENVTQAIGKDRSDLILYNSKKSSKAVALLRRSLPNLEFQGLVGFSPKELRELYGRSKMFVDFGPHPGRDRMPREAVSQGCALITGLRGTASNPRDVPIPTRYKLNENAPNFVQQFDAVAREIVREYDGVFSRDFAPFQAYVLGERLLFRQQLNQFVHQVSCRFSN